MTASAVTMQFLADILASPVDRPAVMETTALGAPISPGGRPGSAPISTVLPRNGGSTADLSRALMQRERERKYAGWQDAVRRTLTPR